MTVIKVALNQVFTKKANILYNQFDNVVFYA